MVDMLAAVLEEARTTTPTEAATTTTMYRSRSGVFSGYITLFTLVLNMLLDDAIIVTSMFIFSTITRSFLFSHVMFIILFFWIKICRIMTIFPTIQKPDRSFLVVGFAISLKPYVFDGSNYKRWKARALWCLTAMQCFFVSWGKPSEPPLSPEEEAKFESVDCLFR